MSPRRQRCWRMTSRSPAAPWCRPSTRLRFSPLPTTPKWPTPSPAGGVSPSTRAATIRRSWNSRRVAALEGAEAARGFSSGMAAISATVLAFVGAGERIVAVRNCYGDAYRLFERLFPRHGHQGRLCRRLGPRRGGRGTARREAALSREPDLDDVRAAGSRASDPAGQGTRHRHHDRQFLGNAHLPEADPARRRSRPAFGVEISRRTQRYGRGRGRGLGRPHRPDQRTDLFLPRRQAVAFRCLAAAARAAHPAAAPAASHEERPDNRRAPEGASACRADQSSGLFEPSGQGDARRLCRACSPSR